VGDEREPDPAPAMVESTVPFAPPPDAKRAADEACRRLRERPARDEDGTTYGECNYGEASIPSASP
jgi:hypothetical protein